jgi:hypothetical protein
VFLRHLASDLADYALMTAFANQRAQLTRVRLVQIALADAEIVEHGTQAVTHTGRELCGSSDGESLEVRRGA